MENRDIIAISGYDKQRIFTSPNPNVKIGIDMNEDGEDNMSDKYVTKDELQLQTQLLNSQIDNKICQLDGKIDSQSKIIDEKFNTLTSKIDGKFDVVDEKINTLNATIEGKFDSLNTKIDSLTKLIWWIMGIIGTGVIIAIISAIIKNFFTK